MAPNKTCPLKKYAKKVQLRALDFQDGSNLHFQHWQVELGYESYSYRFHPAQAGKNYGA